MIGKEPNRFEVVNVTKEIQKNFFFNELSSEMRDKNKMVKSLNAY